MLMSSNKDSDSDRPETETTRRRWLKAAGVGGLTGMAGCLGGGGGGTDTPTSEPATEEPEPTADTAASTTMDSGAGTDTATSGDDSTTSMDDSTTGEDGNESTSGGTTTSASVDLSGTTFKYWNTVNVQSDSAKSTSNEIANSVQERTGANVELNFTTTADIIGANWRTSFRSGNYPVVYDSVVGWAGPYIDQEYVLPFSEYQDRLDDEVVENISWLTDTLEYAYRGYEGDLYEIPYGVNVQAALVGRMDHFEEAGLSPEDDFPPENYEELIEIATTLQDEGPGQHGYAAYGDPSDTIDEYDLGWAVGDGGEQGVYLNGDWSSSLFTNDVWQETLTEYVNLFRDHDLGPQNTPTLSTEEFVTQLATGSASMAGSGFPNLPLIRERAPDLVEDGTIRWAPMYQGDEGYRGSINPYVLALTQKPDGVSREKWDKRQEAGIELINEFLSADVQRSLFENFGFFPAREDIWEDLPIGERADNYLATFKTMAEDGGQSWSAHPLSYEIIVNIAPPHVQQALRGNISPEEALTRIDDDITSRL
jgi:ABC-type glycerol-3-phosphate transport system substrate-binding protein